MGIQTIIIEDEEASRETLRNYLTKYCPQVEIITECKNIIEGKEAIEKHSPQLIFLDVEMPFGNAFDLIEQLEKIDFKIIFVTAYSNYAMKAINHSASYYILKPIDIEELETAVQKVEEELKKEDGDDLQLQTKVLLENLQNNANKKVVLPTLEGFEVVDMEDILHLEANDNFTNFYLRDGSKKVICRTLKFYEDVLKDSGFMRIHRSHMVNLNYITSYKKGKGGQVELTDGSVVDVSASKKDELLKWFS
ncbi:LytR/AlgR family response regulator transcription factor [Parvicella tangerina]|uniref:Transcriptional regulatory protein BtsR n=1 Tax=Parvicella tangerina TaxID=2829795 RepID=A0A916JPF5_9FLAO|nr:LytTR family DNA-binding domain-containing protein [Parvicella tangerina]CAG5085664.1 Transcriptional regulatory protein BtsR [Parvicella tangerina]